MNKSQTDKPDTRNLALNRIVSVAQKISSQAARHVFILGGLSLIMTNTNPNSLPPALAMAAGGIGINLISNMIDRVASGEKVSDIELETQIEKAIKESGIEQILIKIEQLPTKDEFMDEFQKLLEISIQISDEVSNMRTEFDKRSNSSIHQNISIIAAINMYLEDLPYTYSGNTTKSYRTAMSLFQDTLAKHGLSINTMAISSLNEDPVSWFANDLKSYSPATEQLYLNAVRNFYKFLAIQQLMVSNMPRIDTLIRQISRPPVKQIPQSSQGSIDAVLSYAINLIDTPVDNILDRLRNFRDRAFIITLADTGARVHEACGLRRGDLNWSKGYANLPGENDGQDVIRLSSRCLEYLREYLDARSTLDGSSGKPLASLPLFARHDRGAGKKVKPITTRTGQNIITQWVREALGEQAVGTITPHSFRHYFVTTVLRGSGGNLKLAQELARHKNIAVTQRYAHLSDYELDQGYMEIFEK